MNNISNLNYSSTDTLVVALGIFIIFMIIIYTYREFKNMLEENKKKNIKLNEPGECPDYWETVGNKSCHNVHKIGKCGHNNDVNFDNDMFNHPRTGGYMKCRWSRACDTPWEHITNLC